MLFFTLPFILPPASAVADTVYSANFNGTISAINTVDDSVTTSVSLPSGAKPTALCLNPVTSHAYTLNSGTNTISIIDTTNLTIVNSVSDPRFTELTTVACNPTGTSVLIGNNDSGSLTSRILYLDTTSNTMSILDTVVDINPGSIVFNKSGSKAYILSQGVPSLSELDITSKQITATIALSGSDTPYALAMHTLDKYLYVVNIFGNSISFIDPASMVLIKSVPIGSFPYSIAVSAATNKLYVPNYEGSADTVSLLDPESPLAPTSFGGDATSALIERNDGQRVYLASMYDDIVRSYDTTVFTAAPNQIQLPAGSSPKGLATLFGVRHNLNLSISGSGVGAVGWPFTKEYTSAAPVTSSVGVPDGIGVAIHASADSCSTATWTGCDTLSGGGTRSAFCTAVPFTADKGITAIFTANAMHAITYTVPGGHGIISCPTQVCDGGSATCSIAPAPGYTLKSLTDNSISIIGDVTGGAAFQIQNIVADHSVLAEFAISSFTVAASADANGSISPNTPQTVPYGNTISFALSSNPVSVNGCGGSLSGSSYTTAPITGDCSVSASFSAGTFTITSQVPGGGGTVSCQPTVTSGGNVVCTVTPATGYHLTALNDNGSVKTSSVTGNTYQITNVTANHDVVALFAVTQYPVTLNSGSNGSISGPTTANYGDKPAYTFTPSTGYHVSDVIVGGVSVGAVSSYTFSTGISGPETISATFALNTYSVTPSAGAGGTISPATILNVNYGNSASFYLTPNTGYHLVTPIGGTCGGTLTGTTYTTGVITGDCTVVAGFALDAFTIGFTSSGNGTISGAANQTINYNSSTSAITAIPATGYHFVNWTGTGGFITSTTNPLTVTNVISNQSITANFAIDTFTLSFVSGSNGALTGTSSQTVNYGASATAVTAVPAAGYHFVNWTGTGGFVTSTANPLTVTNVTANQLVTGNFAINSYTVTPSVVANGTISPVGGQPVNHGSTASFTITPDTGYSIVTPIGGTCGVTYGGTLSGNTYTTGAITGDCTVIASFILNSYTVTASSGANGTVSPSEYLSVPHGAIRNFTLNPTVGFYVSAAGCNGSLDLASGVFTTGPITGDCNVSVTFIINTYAVALNSGSNGSISGPATVSSGDRPTYTFTPSPGYHINDVIVGGASVGAVSSYTFPVPGVTGSITISATFALNTYSVTPSAGAGGTISPATTQNVNHGNSASFSLTPNTGYHLVIPIVGTCGGTSTGTTYTTGAITGDCSVVAGFALDTFTIGFGSGSNGTLTGTTSQTVNYGASATAITGVPATGYHFVNWTGTGGFVTSTANPLTVTNVTSSQSITANFAIDTFSLSFASGSNGTLTGTSSQTVNYGASATAVTAVPATGYHFVNWTGTGGFVTSTANPLTATNVTASQLVTGNFAVNSYTVTPSAVANGTISPAVNQPVSHGSTASFTITPDTGYHIVTPVGGTCGGTLSGTTYTTGAITADCTVIPSFVLEQYQVTPTAGTGGSISPSTVQTIGHGGSTSFTITPDSVNGYSIVSVSGCGGTLSGTTYTTGAITANCTVTAAFEINSYNITTSIPGGNGSVSCTPTSAFFGTNASCTVVPTDGYQLSSLIDNGVNVMTTGSGSYSINNITANHALAATFTLKSYAVTVSPSTNGSTTPNTVQAVTRGNTISFSLIPDTGYHIVTPVTSICGGTLNGTTFTTAPITADCSVTAQYALNRFTVTATAGNGGSITPGTISTQYGSAPTFSVVTAPGYFIGSVSGCGGTLSGSVYTTGIIHGDCSISATFNAVTSSVTGEKGVISCSTPAVSGDSALCLITPVKGFHLSALSDNGVNVLSSVTNKNSYSLSGVTSSHAITASFAAYSLADALRALRMAVGIHRSKS